MIISLSSGKQVYLDSYLNKFKSLERQVSGDKVVLDLDTNSKSECVALVETVYECLAKGLFQDQNVNYIEIRAPLFFRVISTNDSTLEFLRGRYVNKTNNT